MFIIIMFLFLTFVVRYFFSCPMKLVNYYKYIDVLSILCSDSATHHPCGGITSQILERPPPPTSRTSFQLWPYNLPKLKILAVGSFVSFVCADIQGIPELANVARYSHFCALTGAVVQSIRRQISGNPCSILSKTCRKTGGLTQSSKLIAENQFQHLPKRRHSIVWNIAANITYYDSIP